MGEQLPCDFGCPPGVAACEPSDIARCYELGFRTDGALALQDDNDCIVVGGCVFEFLWRFVSGRRPEFQKRAAVT